MNGEQEQEDKGKIEKPGRGWTERFGSVKYRRFTHSFGDRKVIAFKFEKTPGCDADVTPEVWEILRSVKMINRSADGKRGQHHSGLAFDRSKELGRVWVLPNTPTGRLAADIVDAKLTELAERLAQDSGMGR